MCKLVAEVLKSYTQMKNKFLNVSIILKLVLIIVAGNGASKGIGTVLLIYVGFQINLAILLC